MLTLLRQELDDVHYSVSATTRFPRPGERNGVHYYFVSTERFAEMVEAGEMLEHAFFAGNHYGTPRESVEECLAAGQDVLLEIEVQGARQVRRYPGLGEEAVLLFLAPPSFEELARRLTGRGTEDEATKQARLDAARDELAAEVEFDHTVVNHDVKTSAAALIDLITGPGTSRADGAARTQENDPVPGGTDENSTTNSRTLSDLVTVDPAATTDKK